MGLSAKAIRHRIESGRLHPIWPGVYAVGRPELTRHGEFMAAVLACGPDAVLSHFSAAELWEMRATRDRAIHVSVLAGHDRRRRGLVIHRRFALAPPDVTRCRGIPVTSPVCTLIDIAPRLSAASVETAVNEGNKLDLVEPNELRAALDSAAGRPGVGVLRAILDRHAFTVTDSELERLFLPIARRAGLPTPQTQVELNGFRVDFFFAEIGLVVETDGLRYHRTPAQQARDRRRDQAHTAAGLTPLRFTHAQVRYESSYVESVVRSVARRLTNDC